MLHARLTVIAVALATPSVVWADTTLPASGVYSAAADIGANFYSETPFVPTVSASETAGQTAAIALADYSAQAKTTFGGNHAYTQANGFNNGAFSVGSFSGWYDQVTIIGGTGTGTVQFSVQLNGVVSVGAFSGGAAYGLFASTLHPTQLVDATDIVDTTTLPTRPWALDAPVGFGDNPAVTTVTSYLVGASSYNNTEILFPSEPLGLQGIPSIEDSGDLPGPTPVIYNQILTPGADQIVNVTLTGTLTFTYGEAFYLIGALGTNVVNTTSVFTTFEISEDPTSATPDGTGPTTLDFFNSAHLTGIVLPQGASLNSASGTAYNVTAVPEPGEWLLMLAGLGLVGWRARRRA